ncbi:MAG: AAA family ATPase [Halobacteriota archaeon]|nr:AAA family ATPase [Halobacteriota archaeon]
MTGVLNIKIAVTGKGGVGKTTLAGVLARLFAKDGYDVIAIDADPDMNLASAIGVKGSPKPLSDLKDLIKERAEISEGLIKLNPKVDDIVDNYGVVGPDGVKMLVMGTIERGGGGCACSHNTFLSAFLRHILFKEKLVILDMEAGIEHLGRGTSKGVDLMVIVVEPGSKSVETAKRIKRLASDLGIKDLAAVINKSNGSSIIRDKLAKEEISVIGEIPFDDTLVKADLEGRSPIDFGGSAIDAIKVVKEEISGRYGKKVKS